jgi:hypothetical protein
MAKIQEVRYYPGKSANDCFALETKAFEKAGFQIWKKREIAWLVQAQRTENGKKIEANMSARPGGKTAVTLSISCNEISEADLKTYAETIFSAFEAEIK